MLLTTLVLSRVPQFCPMFDPTDVDPVFLRLESSGKYLIHRIIMMKANNDVRPAIIRRLRSTSICSFHHPPRVEANCLSSSLFSLLPSPYRVQALSDSWTISSVPLLPYRAHAPSGLRDGGQSIVELSRLSWGSLRRSFHSLLTLDASEARMKLRGRSIWREKLSFRDNDLASDFSLTAVRHCNKSHWITHTWRRKAMRRRNSG